jgi:hypothetical protein
MTILFFGAEPEDFTLTGGATTATTSSYRTAYARQSIVTQGGSQFAILPTFTASSTLWFTARLQQTTTTTANFNLATFYDGSNIRLRLRIASGGAPTTLFIDKFDGASATTLGTSTLTIAANTTYKLDVGINYASSGGWVRVYIDGTLFIDSGLTNVTAGGSTTLNGLILGAGYTSSANTHWSEVIVANEDTRPLGVKTLVPDATGDVTGWTAGTWADIDETPASDTDLAVSDTAAQVLAVNCTGMPTGASNLTVRAVKSVVLACRGVTGPTKIDIGLRQSSTNAFASSQTLDTGYAVYTATWTTNPITSAAFTSSEITALQLAYRSAT